MLKTNRIYHQDCFALLKRIDAKSIDLAVIDPPYFLNKGDWDTFRSQDDFLDFTYAWIDALLPTLKETGSLYIFNTPFNSTFILQYLLSQGLCYKNWITWDKRDGFSGGKTKFVPNQETILFFTKSKKHKFNYDEIRYPYQSTARIEHAKKRGILKNGKRWYPNPKGRLVGDVWHYSSERHKTKIDGKTVRLSHVTPKPLDMIERIILASSNENDLVLDCFIGSGTTAVAAKKNSRNYIGGDSNIEYVKFARERLRNATH